MSIGINYQLSRSQPPKWKKLLYLKQPYPDNYTDSSFLDQLKTNSTVVKYSYWKLVYDFSLISFYVSTLMSVILVFISIYHFHANPALPVVFSSLLLAVIAVPVWRHHSESKTSTPMPSPKSFLLINFVLLVLSPVLKSLTRSTSVDSIWALSFSLCLLNTVFHDYAIDISSIATYRPIRSINISIANGIVLASRLNSTTQVFCFLLFVLQMNLLLPAFDFEVRKNLARGGQLHHALLVLIELVVCVLIYQVCNASLVVVWCLSQLGISFCLPGYFLFLQKYKNELQGPWDPAKPIIKTL